MNVRCRIFGHDERYIGEYPNEDGYLQTDVECTRCSHKEVAWVGCHVSDAPEWNTVVTEGGESE